jgi:hypothetical protein
MITYEQKLDRDGDWALREGSMHFEEKSAVHQTLRKIARRLEELGIPFALVGGMAMFFHGFRRFTEDIDILVTPEGLRELHRQLEGLGYLPLFAGSRHLRDTEHGVRVEFLVTGDFPGDGKPKPVAFPDPAEVSTEIEGIKCIRLPKLIELKLASGMTNPGRLSDLADVQRLIANLDLPKDLAGQLDPFVQGKYRELWAAVRNNPSAP